MRLLGGLTLLAPFSLIVAWITNPRAVDSWFSEGVPSILAAIIAGLIGVSMTAMLVYVYARFRLPRLVKALERLADGELGVNVRSKQIGRASCRVCGGVLRGWEGDV